MAVAIARSVAAAATASVPLLDHPSWPRRMAECLVLLCLIFVTPWRKFIIILDSNIGGN